jgi:hypothetical protein
MYKESFEPTATTTSKKEENDFKIHYFKYLMPLSKLSLCVEAINLNKVVCL